MSLFSSFWQPRKSPRESLRSIVLDNRARLIRIERILVMSSADVMNDLAQIKALFAGKASDLQAKLNAAKAAWQADDEAKWNEAHTAAQSIIADMQGTAQAPAPASPAAGDTGSAAGGVAGASDPAAAPMAPAADPSR